MGTPAVYEVWVCDVCNAPIHFRVEAGYEYNDWRGTPTCEDSCPNKRSIYSDDDQGIHRIQIPVEEAPVIRGDPS